MKKLIGFIALLTLVVVGANAAIETYDDQESVYYNLFTLFIENDLIELFATKTEVENARDGESTLLDQIDDLQLYKTEVTAARDGESSLLNQINTIQASIVAVTGANGSLVSSNDTVTGFLNGKLVAGEGIDLTEGNDGGDETLTVSSEDATYTNKGISSYYTYDFGVASGAVQKLLPQALAYTENDTIPAAAFRGNFVFTNTDAEDAVNLTLPEGSDGLHGWVHVTAAQYLRLTAGTGDYFTYNGTDGATTGYVRSNSVGRWFMLTFVEEAWVISDLNGILLMDE